MRVLAVGVYLTRELCPGNSRGTRMCQVCLLELFAIESASTGIKVSLIRSDLSDRVHVAPGVDHDTKPADHLGHYEDSPHSIFKLN